MRRMLPLLLLPLLASAPAADARAQSSPEPTGHWRAMAEEDLGFIHRTIADHHPGPLDTANAAFAEWHRRGYRETVALLDSVTSYGGYRAVLQRYIAGFRDGHLNLNLSLDYRRTGWPEFTVAWRGDAVVVDTVVPGLDAPAPGDRLVSCDGAGVDRLYRERVHPFTGQGIPADRYRHVPELFLDRVNPLLPDLETCVFEGGGEERTVALEWRWVSPAELGAILDGDGGRDEFGQREVAGNGLWIRLPTFGPSGEDLEAAQAIMAGLPDQRDRDFIVLDVRGNGGGSSFWAGELVRQLYGGAWLEKLERELGTGAYPTHRVSADNVAHFQGLLSRIAEQAGRDSRFYRTFATLAEQMARALEDGVEMYDFRGIDGEDDEAHADTDANGERATSDVRPLYTGRLVLLTDAICASACLDFADAVLALPNTVHVGQPTGADTNYMEVRGLSLPSRNGRLNFATKVYRNRGRGHNEWYEPERLWTGDIEDTEALEAWVVEVAEESPPG